MNLSAQEEYGFRCLLRVAGHPGPGPLTIQEIAAAEGMSPEYAGKLMRVLRQGGLVVSTRGAGGGYRLAQPATQMTAWQAVEVLGGGLFSETFCENHSGQERDCVHSTDCSIRLLWVTLSGALDRILQGITLADLSQPRQGLPLEVKLKRLAPAAVGGSLPPIAGPESH